MSTTAKALLQEAKKAEKAGDKRVASLRYAALGVIFRRASKYAEAHRFFLRALHLFPKATRLYLQLALCAKELARHRESEEAMRRFCLRALGGGKQGEYGSLLEVQAAAHPSLREIYYRQALELDRTDGKRFLGLARALREQGKLDEAMRIAVDAFKTKTRDEEAVDLMREIAALLNNSMALEHIARHLDGKLGRSELIVLIEPLPVKRQTAASSSINLEPSQEKSLKQLINELEMEMGIELEERHDTVEPLVRRFRKLSAAIVAGDSKARMDLAVAFSEMGLVKDAAEELGAISETDAHYFEAQCLLGNMLFQSGSELAALDVYQKCRRDERAPLEARCEALYSLAQIYTRLNDKAGAIHELEELERLMPGYRNSRILQRDLKESDARGVGSSFKDPRKRSLVKK